MHRFLLAIAALVAAFAIGCGSGGDKTDDSRDDERPAATAESDEASTDEPADEDEASSDDGDSGDGNVAGFLSPLFGLGLGGATGNGPATLPGTQQGSGELEQYLLSAEDLPDGYEEMGSFSMHVPANFEQDFPGGELAMAMWANGDFAGAEIPEGSMLMIAVMRPDDPSAIDYFADGCDGFDQAAFAEGIGNGDIGALGIEFKDLETLDSTGLGDLACGFGLTMDMSGFFENFQQGFGDALGGEEIPPEVMEAFSAFKMRMRMFGEGDKAGMVMQVGFGADTPMADDLTLAQELRANLQ
jgi:hypothetical protein